MEDEIHYLHNPIMQYDLGVSLHKNNTSCLLLRLYHAMHCLKANNPANSIKKGIKEEVRIIAVSNNSHNTEETKTEMITKALTCLSLTRQNRHHRNHCRRSLTTHAQ